MLLYEGHLKHQECFSGTKNKARLHNYTKFYVNQS